MGVALEVPDEGGGYHSPIIPAENLAELRANRRVARASPGSFCELARGREIAESVAVLRRHGVRSPASGLGSSAISRCVRDDPGMGRFLFLYLGFAIPVVGAIRIDRAARRRG